jgi:hypothetical protein
MDREQYRQYKELIHPEVDRLSPGQPLNRQHLNQKFQLGHYLYSPSFASFV